MFGIIFAEHIEPDKVPAKQIVDDYVRKYEKCGSPAVSDGKNLARFVNANENVVRRWKR